MKLFRTLLFFILLATPADASTIGQGPASRLMARCEGVLYEEKCRLGLYDAETDPEKTGLIGVEFSPLTTSQGHLPDKQASARPAMADVVAEYLRRAGVGEGDWVAVNASASFPGFILASLCAVESMRANAQIVFSYGASMFGGTDPEFTFPVMLDLLNREGLLSTRLRAVAPGGAGDRMAETLLEDPRPTVDLLLASRSEERVDAPSVAEAIRRRLEIFDDTPRVVKCFISCGGPVVALGKTEAVLELPHGLITHFEPIPKDPERGLLFDFLDRGTPVLHLLFVRGICEDFGIPYERVAGQ